jgi:hypothetical protein
MKKNIYFGEVVMFYGVSRSYGFSRGDVERKLNKKYKAHGEGRRVKRMEIKKSRKGGKSREIP